MLSAASCLVDYTTDDVLGVHLTGAALRGTCYGQERSGGAYAGAEIVTWAESGEPGALGTDG